MTATNATQASQWRLRWDEGGIAIGGHYSLSHGHWEGDDEEGYPPQVWLERWDAEGGDWFPAHDADDRQLDPEPLRDGESWEDEQPFIDAEDRLLARHGLTRDSISEVDEPLTS